MTFLQIMAKLLALGRAHLAPLLASVIISLAGEGDLLDRFQHAVVQFLGAEAAAWLIQHLAS